MSDISIGSAGLRMPALSAALTTTEVRLEPRTEDAGKREDSGDPEVGKRTRGKGETPVRLWVR